MSVKFECIHCQTPLDVERLENAKIVIDHFQRITGTDAGVRVASLFSRSFFPAASTIYNDGSL
jgi:hypothetical protein